MRATREVSFSLITVRKQTQRKQHTDNLWSICLGREDSAGLGDGSASGVNDLNATYLYETLSFLILLFSSRAWAKTLNFREFIRLGQNLMLIGGI